ncbi:MAG: hypothetical protein ABIS17_13620 [Casimicrobiaceae bacterium]
MQWHPEFHALADSFIDATPILDEFLAVAARRKTRLTRTDRS